MNQIPTLEYDNADVSSFFREHNFPFEFAEADICRLWDGDVDDPDNTEPFLVTPEKYWAWRGRWQVSVRLCLSLDDFEDSRNDPLADLRSWENEIRKRCPKFKFSIAAIDVHNLDDDTAYVIFDSFESSECLSDVFPITFLGVSSLLSSRKILG